MSVPKCGSWHPLLQGEWSFDKDVDGEMGKIREEVMGMSGMMGGAKRAAAALADKALKLKVEHKEENGTQKIKLEYAAAGKGLMTIETTIPAKEIHVKNTGGDEVTVEVFWESADSARWVHGYNLKVVEVAKDYKLINHFGFGADGKFKVHIIGEGKGKKLEVTRLYK